VTIIRVGATKQYSTGWEAAFSKGKKKAEPAPVVKKSAGKSKAGSKPAAAKSVAAKSGSKAVGSKAVAKASTKKKSPKKGKK
jgi:hypothetical protein